MGRAAVIKNVKDVEFDVKSVCIQYVARVMAKDCASFMILKV